MEANKIYQGEALSVLKTMPSEFVNCVMTSPPYWALRDYGVDNQLGLEATFVEYINRLCDIFDEVKRVLRNDGTCWVNIGDTYSTSGGCGWTGLESKNWEQKAVPHRTFLTGKNLCLIPFRFAIEMQNRGWIVRNTIIWHKRNCMPSSVKDRFTIDFEYLFFFVKNKKYWFEQQTEISIWANKDKRSLIPGGVLSGGKTATGKYATKRVSYTQPKQDMVGKPTYTGFNARYNPVRFKNMRCVWDIVTKGYKEAHFATYPEKLCEIPIKAGCRVGGIVLDPFSGSGTTAVVAKKLGRQYIGIELNPEYVKMSERRIHNETGLL